MPRVKISMAKGEPMSKGRIFCQLKESILIPNIPYRQGDILFAVAAADPLQPNNPNAFKYTHTGDPDLLRTVYADKISDGSFVRQTVAVMTHQGLLSFLVGFVEAQDNPSKRLGRKIKHAWNRMRSANPRFDSLSDEALIAHLRRRAFAPDLSEHRTILSGSSTSRNPRPATTIHSRPLQLPSPASRSVSTPRITPTETYFPEQSDGKINIGIFLEHLRDVSRNPATSLPFGDHTSSADKDNDRPRRKS